MDVKDLRKLGKKGDFRKLNNLMTTNFLKDKIFGWCVDDTYTWWHGELDLEKMTCKQGTCSIKGKSKKNDSMEISCKHQEVEF